MMPPSAWVRRTPIDDLDLLVRTYLKLRNNGFVTVDDVLQFSFDDLSLIFKCFSDSDFGSIESEFAQLGISPAEESADWVRESLQSPGSRPSIRDQLAIRNRE